MDKKPPYLVTTSSGEAAIIIYESDLEIVKKVKLFMAVYGIVDIRMRMLKIPELKKIMGFPSSYKLMGNQAHQKKFIGNAVVTTTACKIIEAFTYSNIFINTNSIAS
jgi:DNA (cytosine-5)-methyltransferase 1